jgi:TonB family protein
MSGRRGCTLVALGALACGRPALPTPDREPPVALNAVSPIQYPPRLFDQRVEGDVVLRMFADSSGRLAPESTQVVESSGSAALDSAALTGAQRLRFAPARRHGQAVAAAFLQLIEFRHPQGGTPLGSPDADPR